IEFDPQTLSFSGNVQPVSANADNTSFTIRVFEQTASLSVAVANDGVDEGLETALFTLAEPGADAGYQVSAANNSATFTIVDTADQIPAPGISEGRFDSLGDTIAEAEATGLSADNNQVTVEAAINGNFFNSSRTRTDNTEDVDMYSVDLAAGDVLRLDIDARINRSSDEAPDTILRLFDADGNQLAQSDDNFAPDELFAQGRQDSYLEFTAETAGTYFVGVSSFGNGEFGFTNAPYDPNVAGSGTGRSDGAYTLNLSLNEAIVGAETEIPASTGAGPTVSLFASPATYNDDDTLAASSLVQFVEDGASILTLALDTDGEIPAEGIEVFLTSNIDLSTVFSTRAPFTPVGAEVQGAIFDDAGAPIGVKVKLTGNAAVFNLNIDNADAAPTDGVQDITFTLEPAAGYQVGGDSTFTTAVYDTLADVPIAPTVPTVGIAVSETALVESTGNLTTLTFTLDSPPPPEGVLVNIDSGVRAALGEFDVFNAAVVGGDFPSPNFRASGFFFRITEQTATITLAAFDETTNPEIPAEDALEGLEEFTFALQPGVGYAINPSANAVMVSIADNPDSVVIPDDDGEDDGNDDSVLRETELNDTIADATDTGLSSTNPVFEVEGVIGGTARATRNLVDQTEDVDMYAFDLEAGQTVILDVDAGGTGDAGVPGSLLDNILRVFDAAGNEVAINENGSAPDEVFQANGDAYLEFTAPETGTYYAGISNLGNNFYDPNVQASGSGWIFPGAFEPGPYRLKATLSEVAPSLPEVSVSITPDQVVEEDDDAAFTATFTVDGEVPPAEFDA
ncbi:MAG: DVUA0089 family protein, partial [Cyanobacteria bacterium P01_C01_bin.147]